MKRLITILICLTMIGASISNLPMITEKISSYFYATNKVIFKEKNAYAKNANYEFVGITEDYTPYNFQELLNIFYTALDSGYNEFTFYCPVEYEDCLADVIKISDSTNGYSSEMLTTLGNYISPFNNFTVLKVRYDTAGEVTISVDHTYSNEDIQIINQKLDELWQQLVTDDMKKEDIIYTFHDYFINTTKYDELYEEEIKNNRITTYQSSKANGVLFEGYAICSGYTDAIALVLDRLELPNFKVASNTHVWNAVKINDTWLHLDLTWDDPVSQDHEKDTLLHKFYLITTETLEGFNIEDHDFNKSIYLELRN